MAAPKTTLTELGTAVGIVYDPDLDLRTALAAAHLPGVEDDAWKPLVLDALEHRDARFDLLLAALANGLAFRRHVLHGRRPHRVEWTGSGRSTWTSDVPRDITVDGVWFIQAKFDSKNLLSTSPSALVDSLLADDGVATRRSWYEAVARLELQRYYDEVLRRLATVEHGALHGGQDLGLPTDVRDLDAASRRKLKVEMGKSLATTGEDAAYGDLCRAVSVETALRWEHRLRAATDAQRTQLLFRMLRIAGGPYWLLGTKGRDPVRLAVTDTRTWRDRFELRALDVTAARAGQPQVDWRAEIADRGTGARRHVEGYCEIRWSHGKLQGNPECKVQVATALSALPGYDPMAG